MANPWFEPRVSKHAPCSSTQRVPCKRLSQSALGVQSLFDQGVPAPLRRHLTDHTIKTASELGWATLTDPELLDRAEADGFDRLITTDRNLKHQQALSGRHLAILMLCTTSWPRLRQQATVVAQAIDTMSAGDHRRFQIQWASFSPDAATL